MPVVSACGGAAARCGAMSRPRNGPPRQHGAGTAGSGAPAAPGRGRGSKGLRDIRVDEEVEIAVNLALERFRYGEDTGEPRGGAGRPRALPEGAARRPRCPGAAAARAVRGQRCHQPAVLGERGGSGY